MPWRSPSSTPRVTSSSAGSAVIRHFRKGTPGWFLLHLVAILITAWLGAVTVFPP